MSEAIAEIYDTIAKQYEISHKYVYLYNETDGKCSIRNDYNYISGKWKLGAKLTNIEWFEFHGFNNGDVLFFERPQGLYLNYSPKNKNKMYSLKYWAIYEGTPDLFCIDTIKWTLEPFSSHYFDYRENMCLWKHKYYEYNEHHHITSDVRFLYDFWNCDTIPFDSVKMDYINKYDERGRLYEYIMYNTSPMSGYIIYTVDSFTYIVRPVGIDEFSLAPPPLSIVPNPGDETVRITAEDSIAVITLYTFDGRLAHTQEGGEKEIILNLQGLAKGIYVVQARLKNGKVQTGKMVAR